MVQNNGKSYRQQRRGEATYVENMGQELGPRNWKTHLCKKLVKRGKKGKGKKQFGDTGDPQT